MTRIQTGLACPKTRTRLTDFLLVPITAPDHGARANQQFLLIPRGTVLDQRYMCESFVGREYSGFIGTFSKCKSLRSKVYYTRCTFKI